VLSSRRGLSYRRGGACPRPFFLEDIAVQGSSIYLIVAYAVVWLGLFVYLAVVAMRMRAVRTELAAVEELVREYQEHSFSTLERVEEGH
jgi:CcmD family protein